MASLVPHPLRRLHDGVLARLRRDPSVARLLFGIDAAADGSEIWDYTTLVLCRAVRPLIEPGQRVWDLGCGPHVTLGRYIRRLAPVEVVASDLEPSCVERAQHAVLRSHDSIDVRCADLGAGIEDRFDLVLFNAPYLPVSAPERLPTSRPRDGAAAEAYLRRFSGGADGMDTIERFLEMIAAHLQPGGRALLGFNLFYLPAARVVEHAERAGLRIARRVRSWWNPSIVLVLEAGR